MHKFYKTYIESLNDELGEMLGMTKIVVIHEETLPEKITVKRKRSVFDIKETADYPDWVSDVSHPDI